MTAANRRELVRIILDRVEASRVRVSRLAETLELSTMAGVHTLLVEAMTAATLLKRAYEDDHDAAAAAAGGILDAVSGELARGTVQGDVPELSPDALVSCVDEVLEELRDNVWSGLYRPGSWERPWLLQAIGEDRLDEVLDSIEVRIEAREASTFQCVKCGKVMIGGDECHGGLCHDCSGCGEVTS